MSTSDRRQILATSGGFRRNPCGGPEWRRGALVDYALRLTGKDRPRICFVGAATGDSLVTLQGFYGAFAGCDDVVPSHLSLFPMPNVEHPAEHLLSQDVIWVGGGSVANLLALWRLHGLDPVFREAWEQGVVLAGVSAGSLCWHVGGTTDSFGLDLRPVTNGLGLLPYANGVHYDSEEQRRPLIQRLVAGGALPPAYCTDDGVGLHYVGTSLDAVVAEVPDAAAYHVEPDGAGGARETRLPATLLG